MKTFIPAIFLSLVTASTLTAGRITEYSRILIDKTQLNSGEAYAILAPHSSRHIWKDSTPYSYPKAVDIYFPYAEPASVSYIKFKTLFDSILDGEIQALVDGTFVPLQRINCTVRDRSRVIEIRLREPVKTNQLRLVLNSVSNSDHDVLRIVDWDIRGELGATAPLFADDDLHLACKAENNVFDLPAPATIAIDLKNSGKSTFEGKLVINWQTYVGFEVPIEDTELDITLAPGQARTIEPSFNYDKQGCYRATAYLYTKDKTMMLAAKRIIVGLRDKALFENADVEEFMPRPNEVIPSAERYSANSTLWGADITQSSLPGRIPGDPFFKRVKGAGGEVLMSFIRYSQFEPLPGVYNFDIFDYLIQKAGKYQLGLNMGLWWWDFAGPTQFWLKGEQKQKEDGTAGRGWEGIYSSFSSKFKTHSLRAVEIMVKRYVNCPEVWLWHPHPYGAVDHDGHGVKDFHPEALIAWSQYLEAKYTVIANLNQRYASHYSAWTSVPVPNSQYEKLREAGHLGEATRALNTSPEWLDWLDFYHQSLLDMRANMMKLVRQYDDKRECVGVLATGGVGKAAKTYEILSEYNGFYGDQGLSVNHQVRRLVAKHQYGLKLRHEDIAPVTIGRGGFTESNIVDRCDWLVYQCTFLGLEHFNYVFTTWDNSPFWDRVYSNPIAQRLVKESSQSSLIKRDVAYLHSFLTDTLVGNYDYQGISLYRWWLMNGFSDAMMEPGNYFEMLSTEGNLDRLDTVRLAIDGCSRVMNESTATKLEEFVRMGGKLVLFAGSGEEILGTDEKYELLRKLGYGDTSELTERDLSVSTLIFNRGNGVFRKTVSLPVSFWCALSVPPNGKVLGYIGDKAGAVNWPYGQGEVVLIAGLPGAITESFVLDLHEKHLASKKKKYRHYRRVWANAERELGQITESLTKDLAEWAGVPPLFSLNSDFFACIREKGDTKLVYMYNKGPNQVPVFRMDLSAGHYGVTCETLTTAYDIGTFSSDDISAPGIELPELPANRYMMIRIEPVSGSSTAPQLRTP